jgi:hypothetical protein
MPAELVPAGSKRGAGIQLVAQISWIPAFAGMTDKASWNKKRSIWVFVDIV